MGNKGSSRIGAIVIVAGVAGVALAFLFRGAGLGPGEGGFPAPTSSETTESVSEQAAEPETEAGFVVVIKGASYQRDGREVTLDELVAEAQAWTTENDGAIRITQDAEDKALSGAVRDLTNALKGAGIPYSEEL